MCIYVCVCSLKHFFYAHLKKTQTLEVYTFQALKILNCLQAKQIKHFIFKSNAECTTCPMPYNLLSLCLHILQVKCRGRLIALKKNGQK